MAKTESKLAAAGGDELLTVGERAGVGALTLRLAESGMTVRIDDPDLIADALAVERPRERRRVVLDRVRRAAQHADLIADVRLTEEPLEKPLDELRRERLAGRQYARVDRGEEAQERRAGERAAFDWSWLPDEDVFGSGQPVERAAVLFARCVKYMGGCSTCFGELSAALEEDGDEALQERVFDLLGDAGGGDWRRPFVIGNSVSGTAAEAVCRACGCIGAGDGEEAAA